jgi:hypothetical protein
MRILLFLALFVVSACVSTQSVVDDLANKYIGKNVDSFFLDHGAPSGRHNLNSGDVVWVWDNGGFANYNADRYGGGIDTLKCVIQIVTSSEGTIKAFNITRDSFGQWTTSMCLESLMMGTMIGAR